MNTKITTIRNGLTTEGSGTERTIIKHKNKVVFVTGAAQGMGLAVAKKFVSEGAKVVAVDINLEAVEAATAPLGENVLAQTCDKKK